MADKSHIIQKIHAELTVPSKESHREQSERLRQAIQNAVENLEPFLDEKVGDTLFRVDSMTIKLTLQNTDFDRLEEHLEKALTEKFAKMINTQSKDIEEQPTMISEQVSPEESYQEILAVFLKTGHLPWWIEPAVFGEAEEWAANLSAEDWISFLTPLAKRQPNVIQRFVVQFSHSFVEPLIQNIVAEEFGDNQLIRLKDEILRFARSLKISEAVCRQIGTDLQAKILENILLDLEPERLKDELLISAINKVGKSPTLQIDTQTVSYELKIWFEKSKEPKTDLWMDRLEEISDDLSQMTDRGEADVIKRKEKQGQRKPDSELSNDKEGLHAIHAGVVILHPFLESLFKNLGYIEDGKFLNEAARERAVCLVYYLATGEEEFPEYELQIPKFLCDWPMDLPVNRFLKLTGSEMEECKSVLSSCIEHWEALKNTSVDGVRNNFLQREGILKKEEFGWQLYIEKKTMDMLLEKLPWNLSIIKLRWMDEMLTVHWH